MANTKIGKNFEEVFAKDWSNSFNNSFIYRLKDQMTGYKETSQNPCDYLCWVRQNNGMLFMAECKSHKGASIPFAAIPQYDRLLAYKGIDGVFPIIIIWFYEKDLVIAVPIEEAEKMVLNDEKSIGVRMLSDEKYKDNIIIVPSTKKRIYMESDYTVLLNLANKILKEGK